jgi:hypothetical protein
MIMTLPTNNAIITKTTLKGVVKETIVTKSQEAIT